MNEWMNEWMNEIFDLYIISLSVRTTRLSRLTLNASYTTIERRTTDAVHVKPIGFY